MSILFKNKVKVTNYHCKTTTIKVFVDFDKITVRMDSKKSLKIKSLATFG